MQPFQRLTPKMAKVELYRVRFENHSPGARRIAVNPTARPVPGNETMVSKLDAV